MSVEVRLSHELLIAHTAFVRFFPCGDKIRVNFQPHIGQYS